jgi:hypothetical protein
MALMAHVKKRWENFHYCRNEDEISSFHSTDGFHFTTKGRWIYSSRNAILNEWRWNCYFQENNMLYTAFGAIQFQDVCDFI